jgi:hypothetical protein
VVLPIDFPAPADRFKDRIIPFSSDFQCRDLQHMNLPDGGNSLLRISLVTKLSLGHACPRSSASNAESAMIIHAACHEAE